MISKLLFAWCLMALCVTNHAVGIGGAVRWLRRVEPESQRLRLWTWIFIRVAGWIILLHLIEIVVWGLFYADEWRLVGAVEALTGILMCGWSTGFFFAVVSRMFEARTSTSVTP